MDEADLLVNTYLNDPDTDSEIDAFVLKIIDDVVKANSVSTFDSAAVEASNSTEVLTTNNQTDSTKHFSPDIFDDRASISGTGQEHFHEEVLSRLENTDGSSEEQDASDTDEIMLDNKENSVKERSVGQRLLNSKYSPRSQSAEVVEMKKNICRLRREMTANALLVSRKPKKPFTPDLNNSLKPYHDQADVNWIEKELDSYDGNMWNRYGQRNTALGIVDPHVAWRMDNISVFTVTRNHGQQCCPTSKCKGSSKQQSNKNASGQRLPPLTQVKLKKIHSPDYQHFKMTYDKVPAFRKDMCAALEQAYEHREKEIYMRTKRTCSRMNLTELRELPQTSFIHVEKAINAYLGSSGGAYRAIREIQKENCN